ncbi:hypothetical protein ACLBKU_12915 [Erythrobacter sp. NE805]|uniref:hypothetical protein n=1 Tax=Erythrobacter sp. NE805 TaxID=3389875 RepID=UPI00396B2BDF
MSGAVTGAGVSRRTVLAGGAAATAALALPPAALAAGHTAFPALVTVSSVTAQDAASLARLIEAIAAAAADGGADRARTWVLVGA